MINVGMMSSATVEWGTPQDFFDKLNAEFGFTLDVCATADNAKCARYFSSHDDGLKQSWVGERVWCNPPYGKGIGDWLMKCADAVMDIEGPQLAVALIPARTDTKWFQDFVLPYAELRWVKGRLKFGGSKNSAPFPSVVAVYRGVK